MANPRSMTENSTSKIPWSKWHQKLHKELLLKPYLLPQDGFVLVAVSGGQDSMALLQLIIDLQRIYKWRIYVWHGNHSWHNESKRIAIALKEWCLKKEIKFYSNEANASSIQTEALARKWRYETLQGIAKTIIADQKRDITCNILTGHTASDRAETLLLNLARGTDLAGLGTLRIQRKINKKLLLTRPFLIFERNETAQICKELDITFWVDPTNKNNNLTRNNIRNLILTKLEKLYPGCSVRMASLAERFQNYKDDQKSLALLAINELKINKKSLRRTSFIELSISARATILTCWFSQIGMPIISSKTLEELSIKISQSPCGKRDLPNGWILEWAKEIILLKK